VGKSNILTRYVKDRYKGEHEVTIGVEFLSKLIKIQDEIIKIQVWDTVIQF